ncbi:MAG: N-acetylmuramoyl-L-alanine amidase [Actinomycetia bacterium]|nr:N-acetylmuramoyl-L-alanine amidase [Actinomycetes bacterium]
MSCAVAVLAVTCLSQAAASAAPSAPATSSIYGGAGSWVDIFATRARANPERVVTALQAHGVTTLYLETSNYSQRADVVHPAVAGRFIDAAHAAGMSVVAWYLPSFAQPLLDTRRALAAIRFRSSAGQGFDSFALDIEASVVRNVALRNARLLQLARTLRAAAPPAYPLGAIVPSPVGMRRHPSYWPGFPFRSLATEFDAFLPMAYFSYYVATRAGAYTYARDVVTAVRRGTGLPDVPIHMIGGIANRIGAPALAGFITAAQDCGVGGLSLYAFLETTPSQWTQMAAATLGGIPAAACR